MNKQALLKKIIGVGDDARSLEQDITILQNAAISSFPDGYSSLSQKAVISAENITRKLRELVYS